MYDRCTQAEPVTKMVNGVETETGVYKFDSAGANKAMDSLAKIHGAYEKDNTQKTPQFLLAVGRADNARAKLVESSIKERDMIEGESVTPAADVATVSPVTHKEGLECPVEGDSHEEVATWEI